MGLKEALRSQGSGFPVSCWILLIFGSVSAVKKEQNQNGFATATAAYLIFADQGADIGGTRKGTLGSGTFADDWDIPRDADTSPDNIGDVAKALGTIPLHCSQEYAIKVPDKNI